MLRGKGNDYYRKADCTYIKFGVNVCVVLMFWWGGGSSRVEMSLKYYFCVYNVYVFAFMDLLGIFVGKENMTF